MLWLSLPELYSKDPSQGEVHYFNYTATLLAAGTLWRQVREYVEPPIDKEGTCVCITLLIRVCSLKLSPRGIKVGRPRNQRGCLEIFRDCKETETFS